MRNLLPYDKATWTLEQMLDYLETGTFLALGAVAKEPERWALDNLYRVPRNAIRSTAGPSGVRASRPASGTCTAVYDMLKVLEQSRVEIDRATAEFTANGKTYPAGSFVYQHASAARQVGGADHGQPAVPGRQELLDVPAADAVFEKRRTTCR